MTVELAQSTPVPGLHGILARFSEPEQVLLAARKAYAMGYRRMDAYTPFPVHGLAEAIGAPRNWVALCTLIGGLLGAIGGFGLQAWVNVPHYPMNVGSRPHLSWPAFIPITFELGILAASITAVVSMLAFNGLPRPHHPVFNAQRFSDVSRDGFFLCIEADDPLFDLAATREFMNSLHPDDVSLVEA